VNLPETCGLFWELLVAPEGPQATRLEECFLGTPALPAADRVRVYANMVLWRQIDALREDFPKLATLCGEDDFYQLAEAYIRRHPSEHPSLARLGRHLASFLDERAAAVGARPDLGALAALEWARAEVFDQAHVAPAAKGALAALPPEGFAAARLVVVPALVQLSVGWDAPAVWQAIEDRETVPPPAAQPREVVVWRPEWEAVHTVLETDEAEALARAARDAPLAQICEAFAARPSAAAAAFDALRSWFDEGWIAAVEPGP
jgi:hypothetical protein